MEMKKIFITFFAFCTSVNAANIAYVEVNSNRFENAGCYIDSTTKQPFFQIADIFAANINGDNPNSPIIYLNPQVTATLSSTQVQHLQHKGIKVLVTLLGNHENAGWACMTDPKAAERFADDVIAFINKYNLDGIDIDDEYSRCETNEYSLIMMAKAIKTHPGFRGKLLTKALFDDTRYFESSYEGHKLYEYLDYGWEMSYFSSDFMGRLKNYLRNGMTLSNLMIGGNAASFHPYPFEIGKFTANNNLAGMMVYDVKTNSQAYLSELQKGFTNGCASVETLPNCLE